MSSTLKPEDQAFFDLVTRFLNEANAMNDREHRSRISAAILFAAARYNAFTWMHRDTMPEQTEEQAVEFFADHYRAMFRDNIAFLRTLEKKG
jgi:hypothetical protein